eukprot:1596038-Prymnesium_polylepis.1
MVTGGSLRSYGGCDVSATGLAVAARQHASGTSFFAFTFSTAFAFAAALSPRCPTGSASSGYSSVPLMQSFSR